jgi:hypothetical protein
MRRKIGLGLLPIMFLVAGFLYYTHNFPRCFDIWLWDETEYMYQGQQSGPIAFSSYEWAPLYSLFYRTISLFVPDPMHLYMAGSILILFAAYLLGAVSVLLLSGNPILTVMLTALSVFSGIYLTWPRVSFAAIALLALAIPFALHFRRFCDKAAILVVAAFLVTFIRPEFISSLYLLSIIATASFLAALRTELKGGLGHSGVLSARLRVPVLSLAAVAVLSIVWTFPIPKGGTRAFIAFGQHYALRYVNDHQLATDPWLQWEQIMAGEFPGARTVGAAFRNSPQKVLGFWARNLHELISQIWGAISQAVLDNALFFGAAGLAFIACAIWRDKAQTTAASAEVRRVSLKGFLTDLSLIAIFAIPPLLGAVFVYPAAHYIIMVEFVACLLVARLLREWGLPGWPAVATVIGFGFLLAIKPLPAVEQQNVTIINALRRLPSVPQMLEVDGGWCYYLNPPCTPIFLEDSVNGAELEVVLKNQTMRAILVSPRMRSYEATHPDMALNFLFKDENRNGWVSYPLAPGYQIFYRPPQRLE